MKFLMNKRNRWRFVEIKGAQLRKIDEKTSLFLKWDKSYKIKGFCYYLLYFGNESKNRRRKGEIFGLDDMVYLYPLKGHICWSSKEYDKMTQRVFNSFENIIIEEPDEPLIRKKR